MAGARVRDRVVLLDDGEAGVTLRRATLRQRLAGHVLAPRLDRQLAAGASPDSSTLLALRAQALVRPENRHALAARLLAIVASTRRLRTRRTPTVPVDAEAVRANRAALVDLAHSIDTPAPVPARGVAQVALLLRDGGGPLFYGHSAAALRAAIRQARQGLDPLGNW